MAVLALLGDIRVMVESANPDCFYDCVSFRQYPILHAGDLCECGQLITVIL